MKALLANIATRLAVIAWALSAPVAEIKEKLKKEEADNDGE